MATHRGMRVFASSVPPTRRGLPDRCHSRASGTDPRPRRRGRRRSQPQPVSEARTDPFLRSRCRAPARRTVRTTALTSSCYPSIFVTSKPCSLDEVAMTLTQLLTAELDREAPRTRKALESVPLGRDDWKPHAKSMPLGRLAGLVASMPSWVTMIIEQDELNLTPPAGGGQYQQPSTDKLVAALEQHVAKARESLAKTNDNFLMTTKWRLLA